VIQSQSKGSNGQTDKKSGERHEKRGHEKREEGYKKIKKNGQKNGSKGRNVQQVHGEKILEVGFDKIGKRLLAFKDCKKSKDGWVLSSDFLPPRFEPVLLITNLPHIRPIPGWWTGTKWFSIRMKEKEKVLKWKNSLQQI